MTTQVIWVKMYRSSSLATSANVKLLLSSHSTLLASRSAPRSGDLDHPGLSFQP